MRAGRGEEEDPRYVIEADGGGIFVCGAGQCGIISLFVCCSHHLIRRSCKPFGPPPPLY